MEATPKAVVGLMKAKASPKMVEEFTETEVVPTVAEGITKAVPNLAEGLSLLPNVKKSLTHGGGRDNTASAQGSVGI